MIGYVTLGADDLQVLELGGRDEGPAGPRGSGFHAGHFRDLDGNKLNGSCTPQAAG